jgi:hypothetical protein
MKTIRNHTIRFLFALMGIGLLSFMQAQNTHTCSSVFEFSVSSGPSAPLTLAGILTMNFDASGAFTGTLEGYEGPLVINGTIRLPNSLPVIGQANGHAITMLIKLSDKQTVFGSGAAEADFSTCDGTILGAMGGPAVGPQVGDSGDWLRRCPKGYMGRPSEC